MRPTPRLPSAMWGYEIGGQGPGSYTTARKCYWGQEKDSHSNISRWHPADTRKRWKETDRAKKRKEAGRQGEIILYVAQ